MASDLRIRVVMASCLLVALGAGVARAGGGKGDFLSDEEADKVRDAQDPSERIELYLNFAQLRLERFDDYRNRPPNPDYDISGYLDVQLDQYIRITDSLKDWIQDHYDRHDDMRLGLRKFVEMGPHQVEELQHFEQSPDPFAAGYRHALDDALSDFSDALDGATQALSEQTKMFGELKREEKAGAQAIKDRAGEEKKRTKEENKLRKKEHEKGPPSDRDED